MSDFEKGPELRGTTNPLEYSQDIVEVERALTTPYRGYTVSELLRFSGDWGEVHPSVDVSNIWTYPLYTGMYPIDLPDDEQFKFRSPLQIDGRAWQSLYKYNNYLPHDLYMEETANQRTTFSDMDAQKIHELVEPREPTIAELDRLPQLGVQRIQAGMPRVVRVFSAILAMRYSDVDSHIPDDLQARVSEAGVALFNLTQEEHELAEELYVSP